MLEQLTNEHKNMMTETRDEWVNLFFDNVKNKRGIDKPLFEDGIKWLYKELLGRSNPKVIYCDSWLSCLISIAIMKNDKIGSSVGDSVSASVRDSVWDSVRYSVEDLINKYSTYINLSNYGWISFYEFFEKIKIIDDFKFKQYKKIIKSGVFIAYEFENCIFAVEPPVYVERNESGRLHSTTSPAIKFKDDTRYYFINGRSIPSWIVENKEAITREMFINEKNSDIKGAIYEVLGQKGMLNLLGAETVDKKEIRHRNGDVETVELLRTRETFQEIEDKPFCWVKMVCPSTGTQYLQGVEPHHTDALDAIASLSPFSREEYSFDYRS